MKMLKGMAWGVMIFFVVLFTIEVQASSDIQDFLYQTELSFNFKEGKLYQLHLTPDILKKSSASLYDLRLLNPQGMEIPYVILDDVQPARGISRKSYSCKIIEFQEKDSESIITAEITAKNSDEIRVLSFDIPEKDFYREVVIYESDDSEKWQEIARDTIYDFSSRVNLRKTEIAVFPSKGKYFRIHLFDPSLHSGKGGEDSVELKYKGLELNMTSLSEKDWKVSKITAKTMAGTSDRKRRLETKDMTDIIIETDEKDRTLILFPCFLPAEKILLHFKSTASYRNVLIVSGVSLEDCRKKYKNNNFIGKGAIYCPPEGHEKGLRNALSVPGKKYSFLMLAIINRDNPPLKIEGVSVQWTRKNLFFLSPVTVSSLNLYLGNEDMKKPQYDIGHFIHHKNWFSQKFQIVAASSIIENVGFKSRMLRKDREKLKQLFLTLFTFLMVGGLALWLYFLSKGITKKPIE